MAAGRERVGPPGLYRSPAGRTTVRPVGGGHFEVGLEGDLTIRGVTRREPVSVRVPAAGDLLRASGDLPIHQPDYHLKQVRVVGSWMKVKDDVKVTFDIVARA